MRATFIIGVILGLAGVLAGAGFFPWIDHPRLPSRTQVVANGGRAEQFIVRLPVDRIVTLGTSEMGIRAQAYPASAVLPADLGREPLLAEHFKVRDTEGNVVGVAARHSTAFGQNTESAWTISIPSRGTLRLTAPEVPAGLDAALTAVDAGSGKPWSGDLRFSVAGEPPEEGPRGRIAGGSGEFAGLGGTYTESWLITGVGEKGELSGTVEISTVTFQGS